MRINAHGMLDCYAVHKHTRSAESEGSYNHSDFSSSYAVLNKIRHQNPVPYPSLKLSVPCGAVLHTGHAHASLLHHQQCDSELHPWTTTNQSSPPYPSTVCCRAVPQSGQKCVLFLCCLRQLGSGTDATTNKSTHHIHHRLSQTTARVCRTQDRPKLPLCSPAAF